MSSVFESFGWKSTANSTLVAPLGINSRIYQLQNRSQKYFIIGDNAKAADGDLLAISVKLDQDFNLKNEDHRSHLRACIDLFKEKSKALSVVDQKIASSAVLGIIATSLSFIPFVGYFGLLGWGSTLYYINQRVTALIEYKESLNLLVSTCNWCLGEGPSDRKSVKEELTTNTDIREMMTALYPVLTEKQVRHLIADDIEENFAQELREYENKYRLSSTANSFFVPAEKKDERIAQSKRSAEFSRCIYGYNKGHVTDYLDAFFSVFPDIYNSIHHGFKRLQHWWKTDSKKNEETQQQVAASI